MNIECVEQFHGLGIEPKQKNFMLKKGKIKMHFSFKLDMTWNSRAGVHYMTNGAGLVFFFLKILFIYS